MIDLQMEREHEPNNEGSYEYTPMQKDRLRAFYRMSKVVQEGKEKLAVGEKIAALSPAGQVIFEITTRQIGLWGSRAHDLYEREFKPHPHLQAAAEEIMRRLHRVEKPDKPQPADPHDDR